jgi:hypothetical protein
MAKALFASIGVITLGLLSVAESTAATITLSGASGNSCTYSSIGPGVGAGDLVVTCGTVQAQCTLSAAPNPVAPGNTVTLTKSAACPAGSVISESATGQSDIANPVSIPANATGTRIFYVVSNGQQQTSATVTISGGNSGATPTCGAVSGPPIVAANASASYSVSCQNATSYSWSAGSLLISGTTNGTAISASAPGAAGSTNVQVTVCGTPSTNCITQSLAVSITSGPSPGQCPVVSGTRTNPGIIEGQLMWDNPGSYDKGQLSGGQIGVYPFVASAQRWPRTLSVDVNTLDGAYNPRDVSVSTCPGDFSANVPAGCTSYNRTFNAIFQGSGSTYCTLEPGRQYYINIRSVSASRPIAYDAGWN